MSTLRQDRARPEHAAVTPSTTTALSVLCADTTLVAVDKPAGLPAVPARAAHLHDNLADRVCAIWDDARVVHRLDMATSGVMLFARGIEAQRRLSDAFAQRQVDKRYIAVVWGHMPHENGTIDLPLAADWPNRPRQIVDAARGKPSVTHYRVLARDESGHTTRVELQPVTGRSHQLRVHLQAIGHPILGDALYATPLAQARAARLQLHATRLVFAHPLSGARIAVSSDPPF